jgi:adenine-specific DNA glycosylase
MARLVRRGTDAENLLQYDRSVLQEAEALFARQEQERLDRKKEEDKEKVRRFDELHAMMEKQAATLLKLTETLGLANELWHAKSVEDTQSFFTEATAAIQIEVEKLLEADSGNKELEKKVELGEEERAKLLKALAGALRRVEKLESRIAKLRKNNHQADDILEGYAQTVTKLVSRMRELGERPDAE